MHISNVDYLLCNVLYNLSSVLGNFPCEELKNEIEQTLSLIQNKSLNVAIIGEFRRGKSSLINALLGMPVLPVDIEPTTAAINRVTYGLKPRAIVHFKDGSSSEIPIGELSDYVTKLTPTSAQLAATVKEAEIQYPTELCSNNIDIIDTPGLNDTESMTAVTESLLDNINIAVVAIKSTMPYSETECEWVTKLLALPKLNHIAFVLTCMDLVKKDEVPKLLSYTKQRIREKTLEKVAEKYKHSPELLEKAERLFSEKEFMLFPVSAILALDSFENGDYELLEESNIASLKKGLLTILNSQQQLSGVYATEQVLCHFKEWFSSVMAEDSMKVLSEQITALSAADTQISEYFAARSGLVESVSLRIQTETTQQMSAWLSDENFENVIRKIFIKHLSSISINSVENIQIALHNAKKEVLFDILPPLQDGLRKAVNAAIIKNCNEFFSIRDSSVHYTDNQKLLDEAGFPSSEALKTQIISHLKAGISLSLPKLNVSFPQAWLNQNLMQTLIIPKIKVFVGAYRKAWKNALPEYTQKWYSIFLQAEPSELCGKFRNTVYSHKGAIKEKNAHLEDKKQNAMALIDTEYDKVKKLKEDLLS